MIDDNNESLLLQAPTILLRVRRQRRGAITARSTTLRVELDAALAAADDAFNEWDINSSDENDHDHLGINQSTSDQDITSNNNNHNTGKIHSHRHRVSVSSRSRQSITSTSTLTTTTTSTAIFRRIESSSLRSHEESAIRKNSFNFNQHKRPRILDAVLLDDGDDDDDLNNSNDRNEDVVFGSHNGSKDVNGGSKKRRRLTLQILEPQKVVEEQQRRRSSLLLQYPILSPQQRAIDDSLQQVFVGTVALQQHCHLIHESAMVLQNEASDDWYWPYVWCHADSGNWLHAAAIWNEANTVREIFHFLEEQFDQLRQSESALSSRNHTYASLIREIIQTQNNEGLNPIQVAHLSSNSEVYAVLEHYCNIYNQDDDFINGDNMDDDDHQYELYSLVVEHNDPDNCNNVSSATNNAGQQLFEENDDDPLLVTSCELHNDCRGYWDERGNLILEAPGTAALDLDLDHNEKNRGAIHQDNLDIDDIDSNDEDWDGNDYPDDDDDNELASDEDGSDNEDYHDFRRRHVNVFHPNHRNIVDCNYDYDDDDDDDAHYDPSYGDIYGQSDSLNR